MENFCRTTKSIDVVLCLDTSKRMLPLLNEFKKNMVNFYDDFYKIEEDYMMSFDVLRVKFIVFDNNTKPVSTKFFDLPDENSEFCEFINNNINNIINNDTTNNINNINNNSIINALESISLAIDSKWFTDSSIRRHVILLFTDASIDSSNLNISENQKEDLKQIAFHHIDNLYNLWDGKSHVMEHKSKRFLSFLPEDTIWDKLDNLSNYYRYISNESCGLDDVDVRLIVALLAKSI